MSALIRFNTQTQRLPGVALMKGIADWMSGSMRLNGGNIDFDDYAPYNSAVIEQDPSEVTIDSAEQFGVIKVFEGNAANEVATIQRTIYHTPEDSNLLVIGGRIKVVSDADSPQLFVGFSDTAVNAVFSSSALAVSSNQDMLGLFWNANETVDIVANVDGTLTTLVDDIGASIERTDGFIQFGLRVEKISATEYRLVPVINNRTYTSIKVANTAIPYNVAMKPTFSLNVDDTTDVDYRADWTVSAED